MTTEQLPVMFMGCRVEVSDDAGIQTMGEAREFVLELVLEHAAGPYYYLKPVLVVTGDAYLEMQRSAMLYHDLPETANEVRPNKPNSSSGDSGINFATGLVIGSSFNGGDCDG